MKPRRFSRIGFILAGLGMAIGTGNIWRFPRVAAENGGGSFIIPWLVALFVWSIPLLLVEAAFGRKARRGVVGTFVVLLGRKHAWLGGFVAAVTLAITFYYSVVAGWCARYLIEALNPGFGGANVESSRFLWESFTAGVEPSLFHLLALAAGTGVILLGVKRGIELSSKILIPSLFIILAVLAVRAVTLPGGTEGLSYLFSVDSGQLLHYKTWLEAFSQSAWSTGAGWGLLLTYAVYTKAKEDVTGSTLAIGIGNNVASLLAACAVIPTVFALLPAERASEALGAGNTGLTFIYLPALFGSMPAGRLFSVIFFLALLLAAISSLIAMLELGARVVMDYGLKRRNAALVVGFGALVLGLPSAWSLKFHQNQDWVWGVGLLVSGVIMAGGAIRYGLRKITKELNSTSSLKVGPLFRVNVAVIVPFVFTSLMAWWLYQSTTWDPRWWSPFAEYSLATTLGQWALLAALLLVFNGWLGRVRVE